MGGAIEAFEGGLGRVKMATPPAEVGEGPKKEAAAAAASSSPLQTPQSDLSREQLFDLVVDTFLEKMTEASRCVSGHQAGLRGGAKQAPSARARS